MKAAIYNPYLDTLGGGERYTVSFAKVLLNMGYKVDIEWQDELIKKKLISRFEVDVDEAQIVTDIKKGDGYDLTFWISDGSIPALRSRKNLLHFQIPFHDINGATLLNKMKLFRVNKIICNSNFTKSIVDKEYGVGSIVIYPPIDTSQIKSKRKENIILYVGRFSQLKQSKHQDILIRAFKKLHDMGVKDWKLILAGGIEVGTGSFIRNLKQSIENYPIEIIESPDFKSLKRLYGKAKIFWSASGYGEDQNKDPDRVEHFGITVVEAMSARAVPIVFDAGGHKEIIKAEKNGFLWNTEAELVQLTKKIIADSTVFRKVSVLAFESSKDYSYANFESNIKKLL